MSVYLENIKKQTFKDFYEESIIEYAEEHVKSGDWEEEGSIERACTEFEKLLPEGLNTRNQYLLSVNYNNVYIGYLWLHIFGHNKRAVFLYNKVGFVTTNYRMEKRLK